MKMIVSIAAALILPSAGLAVAQPAPEQHESIERLLHQPQDPNARAEQDGDVETVEVANPFKPDADRPQLIRKVSDDSQLQFGPYNRPEFAQAPAPDGAPKPRGAVGLAFSMKLGG